MQLHTDVIRRWVIQAKTLCAMNRSIIPYTLSSSISTLRTGISIYISECSIFTSLIDNQKLVTCRQSVHTVEMVSGSIR